jgi:hypothetical protein
LPFPASGVPPESSPASPPESSPGGDPSSVVPESVMLASFVPEASVVPPSGTSTQVLFGSQVFPDGHVPQSSEPPQPSAGFPHVAPSCPHVFGLHPQTFGFPPPPQVSRPLHVPQLRVPPQPSGGVPQLSPSFAHVVGVQPHWY